MSDFPSPAKVTITSDRVAVVQISRPRAYYSRGGTKRLLADAIAVVVTFDSPVKDTNWVFGGLTFWNSADADVDVVFIGAIARVLKSQSGFTLLLSAAPPNSDHFLDWTIAEKTEADS